IISTVLVARHVVVEAGGFDERLRGAEDLRLFARISLVGRKAIAIDRPLTVRRLFDHGLMRSPIGGQPWEIYALLANMADMTAYPILWREVWTRLLYVSTWPDWAIACVLDNVAARPFQDVFSRAIAYVDDAARCHGLSGKPLLAILDGVLAAAPSRRQEGRPFEFEKHLRQLISAALSHACEPGPADLVHWTARPALTEEIP